MGIQDRDYMQHGARANRAPRRRWMDRITPLGALAIVAAVLALAAGALWVFPRSQPMPEGSLIVNINTATLEELETLPGIGRARAVIISENRPYASVDELKRVNSLPDGLIEDLQPLLVVDGKTRRRTSDNAR